MASVPVRNSGWLHPAGGWQYALLLVLAMSFAYLATAKLSLALQLKPESIAVFWPASGLAAGALIALGPAARLPVATAVLLATVGANLLDGKGMALAAIFGLCNVGECLIMAGLTQALYGPSFRLDSRWRVFGFFALAGFSAALPASLAALALQRIAGVEVRFAELWQTWLEADAIGIAVVAPLLIELPPLLRDPPRGRMYEALGVLVLAAVAAVLVFSGPASGSIWASLAPVLLMFLLIWLATRFPPFFAAAGALVVAILIVWTTGSGHGWLGGGEQAPLADRTFAAQMAMLTYAVSALVVSSLNAEQRSVEQQLRTREQRLRIATRAAGLGIYERDLARDVAVWENDRMYELFGHGRDDGPINRRELIDSYVHPDDRQGFDEAMQRSLATGELRVQCRIRRKDGEWRQIEMVASIERDRAGRPERTVGVMADVTERVHAEQQLRLLAAELDHRVKNALERVLSVVRSTGAGATSVEAFVETLDGRIAAMAQAHQLLSGAKWQGVGLRRLVAEQLAAYADPGRVAIAGDDVLLTPEATQALAMALHELVTNAAKYGALSTPQGHIAVSWQQSADDAAPDGTGRLEIDWRESNGPPVVPPQRAGFGTRIISEPIRYELGGTVHIAYPPEGVSCRITVPLHRVRKAGEWEPDRAVPRATPSPPVRST